MAVVDEDAPQGTILWVNERARRARIWPGCRYAEALSLERALRAGAMPASAIAAAAAEVLEVCRRFSSEVEPSQAEPGVLWLNATGVEDLFRGHAAWAAQLVAALRARGLRAAAVVGFDRFDTYALARAAIGSRALATRDEERALADRVPLQRLGLEPKLRDALLQLGVADLGAFRRLPAGSLRARFGADADRLHRLARGTRPDPLAPAPAPLHAHSRYEREPDEHEIDVQALVFVAKQKLAELAPALRAQGLAIAALRLRLLFEKAPPRDEHVRPAAPTLDEVQLVDLLRLRLEAIRLDAEPVGFELSAEAMPVTAAPRELFDAPRRDLAAANRALARLRAELGDEAVVRAELRDGHLPRARFAWQLLQRLEAPQVRPPTSPRLVRRILDRPRLLAPAAPDDHDRGRPIPGVQELRGPHLVSGGWWQREQHREYWFAQTREGDVLWIYYDRQRRQWFLEGVVE